MHVKLFTLRFNGSVGAFDDASLQEFCRGRDLIGFREHFFLLHDMPHVLCILTWQDGAPPRPVSTAPAGEVRPAAAPRAATPPEAFSDVERALFDSLRGWRSRRAKRDGVPPYVVLTNRELAEVVRQRPLSLNALGQIAGIGAGKVARFGADLLEALGGAVPVDEPAVASVTQAPSA